MYVLEYAVVHIRFWGYLSSASVVLYTDHRPQFGALRRFCFLPIDPVTKAVARDALAAHCSIMRCYKEAFLKYENIEEGW